MTSSSVVTGISISPSLVKIAPLRTVVLEPQAIALFAMQPGMDGFDPRLRRKIRFQGAVGDRVGLERETRSKRSPTRLAKLRIVSPSYEPPST